MLYRALADIVILMHMGFVLFVVLGGLLVIRWRYLIWLHLPAAIWGVTIEFKGWICPLTPLENWLRYKGGSTPYHTSFVEHYFIPVLYPTGLTPRHQLWLGILVLAVNLGIYIWMLMRYFDKRDA